MKTSVPDAEVSDHADRRPTTRTSVSFAGTVDEAQFSRIQQALLPVWMRWYVFAPACLITFIGLQGPLAEVLQDVSRAVTGLLWGLGTLAIASQIVKYGRRRAWKTYLRIQGAVSGQLSADGIVWKTESSTTSLSWEKLVGHRVLNDLALLFYAPRCAFFVPRTFVASEQDWSSLKQLLAEHSRTV